MLCQCSLQLANALPFAVLLHSLPTDGGKLLCDVSQLAPPCLIYSLGSNGDYSFEHDMLNVTK